MRSIIGGNNPSSMLSSKILNPLSSNKFGVLGSSFGPVIKIQTQAEIEA